MTDAPHTGTEHIEPMNDRVTVLVLGGGVGGVVAATALRRRLPEPHRVMLVDREPDHLFAPSLLWLITGKRSARQITRPLDRLRRRGIEFVRGEIEHIDPSERRVRIVAGGMAHDVACDHLVISLGADLAPETVPGLAVAGFNIYTLAGAQRLRDALLGLSGGGSVAVVTPPPPYKCPAAPYEAAMLILDALRARGLGSTARVDLFTAESGPMGVAGSEVSAAVRSMVEEHGVSYHPDHAVASVDPAARRVTFANGVSAVFDVLGFVPPHRVSGVVARAGLAGDSGWVSVDPGTLQTAFPGVYAVGDVTGIPLTMGKPLPKAGVFAELEAKVVAQNIARAVTGKGRPTRYDGRGACFIEAGGGKAGFGKGNFYAEPVPTIRLHRPSYRWHLAKILFEQNWLRRRLR